MNDASPQTPAVRAETAPAIARPGALTRFAAMRERAQRLRWRVVARTNRPVRILAPVLTTLLILMWPLILVLMGIAVFLPGRLRLNPALMMLAVGGVVDSLSRGGGQDDRRLT